GAHRRRRGRLPRPDLQGDRRYYLLLLRRHVASRLPAIRTAGSDRPPARLVSAVPQTFATWSKDSSTGVSRSKMLTNTLSFAWSALISLIVPLKSANGPLMMRTTSPSSKPSLTCGFCSSFFTTRIFSTSRLDRGVGL